MRRFLARMLLLAVPVLLGLCSTAFATVSQSLPDTSLPTAESLAVAGIHDPSGFAYDAQADVAQSRTVETASSVARMDSLKGAAAIASCGVGHAYDSVGSFVAPNSSRIFRAVEADELADLVGSGQYRNIPGIGDGKYFFLTSQQADDFAALMTKADKGPFCTTSGCVSSDVLGQVWSDTIGGEGLAYYIPEEMLPLIDDILIHGG